MYRLLFDTVLRHMPAELMHHAAFGALRAAMSLPGVGALSRRVLGPDDAALEIDVLGTRFPGPLGLGAGFDKDAAGPDALGALGFAFVEIGTVTSKPQEGNPKPRLFRLTGDRALVNRMGFNNLGVERVAARLERRRRRAKRTILAVNIGKSKVVPESGAALDYALTARALARDAAFCVVNVSSPNTPGLRDLQRVEALRPILEAVRAALDEAEPSRRVPLLVKIAPDLADEDVDRVAELALELGLDGIVATNTTIGRAGLRSSAIDVERVGAGGLSGAPLRARSLEVLARLRRKVGSRLVLVGVGGIETADDAWERITHGASLLELYSGFVYGGPLVAYRIHRGLAQRLAREGYARLSDAVGSAVDGQRASEVTSEARTPLTTSSLEERAEEA